MLGCLPALLNRFGVAWVEVGIHQGRLRALQFLVSLLTYIAIGYVIDHIAAIKVFVTFLLFQVIVMSLCAFIFDISTLYIASALIGFVCCNRVAAKCVAFQLSNESNTPEVLNYGLSTPSNLAALLGPTIGGYLALPTIQYPQVFQHILFFRRFPVWLPSILIESMLLITFLLSFSVLCRLAKSKQKEEQRNQQESLLPSDAITQDFPTESYDPDSTSQSYVDDEKHWSLRNCIDFIIQRHIISLFVAKFLCRLSGSLLPKLYSLWALTPHSDGGMGYSPKESANLTAWASALLFLVDLVVPSFILRLLGYKTSLYASLITLSLVISMFWFPARMENKNVAFVAILSALIVARVFTTIVRVAAWAMLKNIIPKKILGRVMAVESCLLSACSILGELMVGNCFSWSLSNVKETSGYVMFPMNEPFTFYLLSMLAVFGSFAAAMCSKDAEKSLL